MMAGICLIKPEYLIINDESIIKNEMVSTNTTDAAVIENGQDIIDSELLVPPIKKIRLSGSQKRKLKQKGQNKSRPVYKSLRTDNLCATLHDGDVNSKKCTYERCQYIHDIEKYMENKPPDIGDLCYIYSTKGYCPRGLTCRFAKVHVDANGMNRKTDVYNPNASDDYINRLSNELQNQLRKKVYDFNKSKVIIKEMEDLRNTTKKSSEEDDITPTEPTNIEEKILNTNLEINDELQQKLPQSPTVSNEQKPLGYTSDMDIIKERSAERKTINFRNKLLLSPLTTVGNLPFRRICKEYGADITCGEMACSIPIINGLSQEWVLSRRHITEDLFGVQLCGNSAQLVTFAAQVIKEQCDIDFIDLNLGCPIELIFKQGGGSALLRRQNVLETLIRSCTKLLDGIPFTVKTRTGIYANKNIAHEFIPKFEEWGAKAVTIHGRSREQRYTKNADWKYIQHCAMQAKNIPIIGNGDILSYDDYLMVKETSPNVSSIMIGRGALIKPWIFQEIKDQKYLDPSSSERFDIIKKYINYGLEHWGSDTKGVETTRRFFLEWQSFLYRYVPYGLLERPPQKINERPDSYRGRNDLETLMASAKSSDWIKLSEMFLGPVPNEFTFLPKHKANAY